MRKPTHPALLHLIIVATGVSYFLWLFRTLPWTPTRVAGFLILFPSLALWFLARIQLGSSFSFQARATELVTHGLYSRIRNPVYLFGGLDILGMILYAQAFRFLWVFAVIVPMQLLRIRKEEKVLEEKFGPTYLDYKRRTWF